MPDTGYYANERGDVIAALPRPLGRVLDVGTGQGGTAPGLRAAGATEIVGIEVLPEPAARAAEVLDRVVVAPVEQALDEDLGTFDTILCLDVLEHLADAATVLERLRAIARPGGALSVSVPNARHYSLVRDLVFKGTFGYGDWGHRDRTHLRWFTPRDIRDTVAGAGWAVDEVAWPPLGRSAGLSRLTGGRSSEFLVAQVYVRAHNPA
ncbi:MAG TPA: class I SAM-dependent methyltransferase [Baekduia sp.]|uniref:class I SAM-dependent methyltransferase n=1 Tax=Baekduia sp. TaxID=2600305 RepID=UPI002D78E690|nr:class I SAM-dependent methyltransferase [Baekduia sp.]HET6509473.1 class I SAM-dependent methyltransferase [Baekduia sp.]